MTEFINYENPPKYNQLENRTISKGKKILNLIQNYEIQSFFSEKLDILSNYDIVLLCDDSGSMNTPLSDNTGHNTRWEELKTVIKIVISIATIFDDDGIDIYFLNRMDNMAVKSYDEVSIILEDPPYGGTPLTQKMVQIFNDYRKNDKPVLIIVATDGVPTCNGYEDLGNFKNCIVNKDHSKFYISFLACSDNNDEINYLNDLDKEVPNVDTLDDYISEKEEVLNVQGSQFSYKFSDHIVRLLLGPLCPELDKLDEEKISKTKLEKKNLKGKKKQNCIIL